MILHSNEFRYCFISAVYDKLHFAVCWKLTLVFIVATNEQMKSTRRWNFATYLLNSVVVTCQWVLNARKKEIGFEVPAFFSSKFNELEK